MTNPYQTAWKVLQQQIEQGKTGWGKRELLAVMGQIELGVLRGNYVAPTVLVAEPLARYFSPQCEDAEKQADFELDKAIDGGLVGSGIRAGLSEQDLQALEAELDRAEEARVE